MGTYSKSISKRFLHTKITTGYCLICGNYRRLSPDHVPPKGSITITKIEQRHIAEMMGVNASKIKGVPSPNGSKFKTICHSCNNTHLGENDTEIARVCKSLTASIQKYFRYADSPYTIVKENVDAIKYARAMIGHILSATSVKECKKEPEPSPYFDPLKSFVLGNDSAIQESHDIYYWYYPFNKHISAKCIGFYNNGNTAIVSLLSFFPISFMVTKKGEGIYPAHANKLLLTDKQLRLDLSSKGYEVSEFPFHGLQGNQMMALTDYQTIISYPVGQ